MLTNMDKQNRNRLQKINIKYRGIGRFLFVLFLVNLFMSGIVVYHNYYNNSTLITFTTNSLFMINRIFWVLRITSSGEYNIYSAYRNDNLIYNRDKQAYLQHMIKYDENEVEIMMDEN